MKKITLPTSTLKYLLIAGISISSVLFYNCSGDGTPRIKDSTETTIQEPTKGTITELEEIAPGDEYKIIDERLIDERQNSVAIVHRLDGKTDTLSLQKIQSDNSGQGHMSPLRAILMYSLASSFFRGNMSAVAPNASSYKSPEAYSKSAGLRDEMAKTSRARTVKVPGNASKGYGSGKSFRSYGG